MTVDTHQNAADVLNDPRGCAGDAGTILSWDLEHDGVGLIVTYQQIRRQTARVTLTGQLVSFVVHETRDALLGALTWAVHWIEVDAGGLDSCDSAGLKLLLEFDRRCSERAGRLQVVSARSQLVQLLDVNGASMLVTRLGTLIG